MREDYFTYTEADAAAFERHRAADEYDERPTRAELARDEADEVSWPKAFDAWDAHEMDEAQDRLEHESRICHQELCQNWTGQGCACEVLDIKPVVVEDGLAP